MFIFLVTICWFTYFFHVFMLFKFEANVDSSLAVVMQARQHAASLARLMFTANFNSPALGLHALIIDWTEISERNSRHCYYICTYTNWKQNIRRKPLAASCFRNCITVECIPVIHREPPFAYQFMCSTEALSDWQSMIDGQSLIIVSQFDAQRCNSTFNVHC